MDTKVQKYLSTKVKVSRKVPSKKYHTIQYAGLNFDEQNISSDKIFVIDPKILTVLSVEILSYKV